MFTGFAEDFSVSLDHWRIDIEGAINALPFQQTVDKCVDSSSLDNPFCPLVTRGDEFAVLFINTSDVNIGNLLAEGFDFQLAYYRHGIGRLPGLINVRLNVPACASA